MSLLKNRIKAFGHAFNGFVFLIKSETHFKIQITIGFIMIVMGFYYNISNLEWLVQSLVTALVLCAEALNTSIEKLCDFIHKQKNKNIKIIKDVAAAAVFITSIAALVIGLIIYIPKIFS